MLITGNRYTVRRNRETILDHVREFIADAIGGNTVDPENTDGNNVIVTARHTISPARGALQIR